MWKRFSALISLIIILFGSSSIPLGTVFAQESGPALTIPAGVTGYVNSQVDVPVHFQGNGHAINALTFALEFDTAILSLDPGDVVFSLPAGFTGSAFIPPGGSGRVNLSVFSISTQGLPDGPFVTLPFTASCPTGAGAQVTTSVTFAGDPPASFGSVQGQDVPGSATGQQVTIDCSGPPPDVNHPPQARDDAGALYEDRSAWIYVLANDQDVDGDPLSIAAFTQPAHGRVTANGSRLLYRPEADFFGADSFTYTAGDGRGGTDTATVRMTVLPVNDRPTAQDDAATTDEDTPVTIPVLANDSDVDGDTLSVAYLEQLRQGQVTLEADGSLRYTPPADFSGQVRFRYTVQDGHGGQANARVTVTVNPVNDPPTALDDAAITQAGESVDVDVLDNDEDADGDNLTVSGVANPANGTATVRNNGKVRYTPDAGFSGTERFTYTVGDGQGGQATGTVTVLVQADPAGASGVTARRDYRSTWEDSSVLVQVLANDRAANGTPLQVLSVTQPQHGAVQVEGLAVRYTPDPDYNGQDAFSYLAGDGGTGAGTAEVHIFVIPRNDPPAAEDDAATAQMGQRVTIPVLANDSDPDGDRLGLAGWSRANGGWVRRAGTSLRYVPRRGFSGQDSFTYRVTDYRGGFANATVRVTVEAVNRRPIAQGDVVTTDEDTPVTIPVLANDSDPEGEPLTIILVGQGRLGAVTTDGAQITYIPRADRSGVDWFTYIVSDGTNHARASVRVRIRPVPDPPEAQADAYLLPGTGRSADAGVTINVLGNDVDRDGDALRVLSVGQPDQGTATLNGDGTVRYEAPAGFQGTAAFTYTVAAVDNSAIVEEGVARVIAPQAGLVTAGDDEATTPEDEPLVLDVLGNDVHNGGGDLRILGFTSARNGRVILQADGTLLYTPNPDFSGQDSFTYVAGDGNLGAAQGQVTITVTPVNDPPQAGPDDATTDEDQAVTIDVLANDSDPEQQALSLAQITEPANGAVKDNGDGTVTYTPQADYFGDDSFSYTVADGQGGESETVVQVTVQPVGDPPDLGEDLEFVQEDEAVTIDVLANDFDPDDDALTVSGFTQPTQGVVAQAADGGLVYTPTHDFAGIDAFSYVASDGVLTATTAVTVTVNPVNDPPLAQADVVTVTHSAPVTLTVLANDVDGDGDALIIESVDAEGLQGQLDWDGEQIVYTPAADFEGVERFSYVVSDGVVTDTAPVEVRAIMAAAALDLTLDPSVETTVQPGQAISYTLDVRNTGRLPLTDAELRIQIPENVAILQVVSSLGGRSRQPRQTGTELVWQVQELGLGQRIHVAFVLRPDAIWQGRALSVEASFRSDQVPALRTQPVTVQVGQAPGGQNAGAVFLPLIAATTAPQGSGADLPDLVVEQVWADPGNITLRLVNRGAGPVVNEFWVDVYIAPETPPTQVNQAWSNLADQGLVWGVTGNALPLQPGQELMLTLGDAYYRAEYSRFSGALPQGTPVYAQVDSYNAATTYGAVLEVHEQAGTAYNNIVGPFLVAASGNGPGPNVVPSGPRTGAFAPLPARPIP